MPLSRGNIVDWTDIQSIYNTLNTVRRKFSIATVSVPNYESSLTLPSHVSNLIENITTLSSNKYIGSNATVNTTIPTRGDLLKPDPFNAAIDTLNRVSQLNAFDGFYSTHDASFNSFNDHDNFDDFDDFDGFRDFDSGFRDHDDHDGSHRDHDGFNGFRSFDRFSEGDRRLSFP